LAEHDHSSPAGNRTPLALALGITTVFMVVEVVGGILTNSLALLSDAGHMLSDASALGLSLLAISLAGRAHAPGRTFGYHRAEILAALANGLTLGVVSLYVFWEAAHRFTEPPEVDSAPMLVVAGIGLAANGISGVILSRQAGSSLNVRSAFLHVLGDALGSVGAIAAGVVMLTTGWYLADPLISVVIAVLILISGVRVTREALGIVLEFVPKHISIDDVRTTILSIDGVTDVHDLHVWTITSGFVAMTCHARVHESADTAAILRCATDALSGRFQIRHVTIQPEHEPMHGEKPGVCCLDEHAMEPGETGAGG
jgi:cobalt-zinc-cadmium efflux system protein